MIISWLPDALSVLRLVLGPVIALVAAQHNWKLALAFIVVGGLTDWFDGYFASRWSIQTNHGDLMENVCDSVYSVGAIAGLVFAGVWPLLKTALILLPIWLALSAGYLSESGSRWYRFSDGITALYYLGVISVVLAVYGKLAFPGAVKYWPLWVALYVAAAFFSAWKKKARVNKWLDWGR